MQNRSWVRGGVMPLLVTHSHFILFGHCLAVVKEHERLGEPRGPMNKFFFFFSTIPIHCWIAIQLWIFMWVLVVLFIIYFSLTDVWRKTKLLLMTYVLNRRVYISRYLTHAYKHTNMPMQCFVFAFFLKNNFQYFLQIFSKS